MILIPLLPAVIRRWLWPPVEQLAVPAPPGADEDRDHEEEEKQEFAEQLHEARRRVHFLEVAAAVVQRRKERNAP